MEVFTREDWAKYPFLPGASQYFKGLGLGLPELDRPEYRPILDRAEERVRQAILRGRVDAEFFDVDLEALSFVVALMLVSLTGNDYLRRRYALAEAERARVYLSRESLEKLLEIAHSVGWRMRRVDASREPPDYQFALSLKDYLKNSTGFHDLRWKLVNRLVHRGWVYITSGEAARLLVEEIKRIVEERAGRRVDGKIPEGLQLRVNKIRALLSEREIGRVEEVPKGVYLEHFPPCIRNLYDALLNKRHISHVGRFTLTTFLLNIGMTPEEVIKLFSSLTDFDERITRYQVEHIAGERGSRTKYTPPKCETLRTHGLCVGADRLCRRIKHPLTYYKLKLRSVSKTKAMEGEKI